MTAPADRLDLTDHEHRQRLTRIAYGADLEEGDLPVSDTERRVAGEVYGLEGKAARDAVWSTIQPQSEEDDDEDIATGEIIIHKLPTAIHPAAFHGPLGDWATRASGRTTEASAVAMYALALSTISAMIGRNRWMNLGDMRAHARVNTLLVGSTSLGRKGTAHSAMDALMDGYGAVERVPGYRDITGRLRSLNSGEGAEQALITAAEGSNTVSAAVWVPEFQTITSRGQRQGSSLPSFIRNMFDGSPVSRKTANTGTNGDVPFPHVTISAAVTPEELRKITGQTDRESGFLNRFLVLGVEGTFIPHIPEQDDNALAVCANDLLVALEWAKDNVGPTRLSRTADTAYFQWRHELLTRRTSGAIGGMENRAENHVLAVALTLATIDRSETIRIEHLRAALALWALHERTIRGIWAVTPQAGNHSRVWNLARSRGDEGVTASDVKRRAFGKHGGPFAEATIADLVRSGWLEQFRSTINAKTPRLRAVDLASGGDGTTTIVERLVGVEENDHASEAPAGTSHARTQAEDRRLLNYNTGYTHTLPPSLYTQDHLLD